MKNPKEEFKAFRVTNDKIGLSYLGKETPDFHTRTYLKTGPGLPYSDLHAAIRKHGIDWFKFEEKTVTSLENRGPRPPEVKKKFRKP